MASSTRQPGRVSGKFLATFKEFPPSQRPSSFSIDQMVDEMRRRDAVGPTSPSTGQWDGDGSNSTLKSELGERFRSPQEAKHELVDYIEVFYNQKRRHSTIGYVSPADFERRYTLNERTAA